MQTKRTAESKRPVPMVSGQSPTGESALLDAWRAHLQALGKPWLTHSRDLWQRFIRTYDHLRQQPRHVRRRVQRQWKASLAGAALALALLNAPAHAAAYTANDAATLIAAITAANADPDADTITLTDDITLTTAATYAYASDTGLPVISSAITIQGAGHTIGRDAAAPAFRLLATTNSGDLTLQAVTLRGGVSSATGGAIYSLGTLTVNNSILSDNHADTPYAGSGGAIYNNGGTLTVNNSTISGNSAAARGGGIANFGAATVNNSTISGNNTFNGGGIYTALDTLTVNNSTITGNSATNAGGGIANYNGSLTLNRSLIAGNSGHYGAEIFSGNTDDHLQANNFNLIGHDGNAFTDLHGGRLGATDIVPTQGVAAILDATLQVNGSGTPTHALVPGSPAIDAAGGRGVSAADQRGVTRTQGCADDIGAFETEGAGPPNARINGVDCNLIDAINVANVKPNADTITLTSDITLTAVNNSGRFGSNGLPVISSAIVIEGANHTIHRASGAPTFRLFEVVATGDLTLNQTMLTGGNAAREAVGGQRGFGGAIINAGNLTVSNSILSGNQSAYSGGAINNIGMLTVTLSSLSSNTASNNGGGAIRNDGVATVTNSTLSGNTSLDGGGAIYNYSTLHVANSTINNNTASYAGGIYNSSVLTLENSTLSGNTTTGNGGALYNAGWKNGVSTVNHSTLTGNTAAAGGAMYNASDGTIHLNTSIVSGNTAGDGAEINNAGAITGNTNLLGESSKDNAAAMVGFTPDASDITATSDGTHATALAAILNPTLADNGGPSTGSGAATWTHALVPNSPAIDAAGNSGLATDQRGISRPQGVAADIGAVEMATTQLNTGSTITQQSFTASFNPAAQPCGGQSLPRHTITPTLHNNHASNSYYNLYFVVTELGYTTPQILGGVTYTPTLCNADGGIGGGVGAKLSVVAATLSDGLLAPAESFAQAFQVGLPLRARYRLFVNLYGIPATITAADAQAGALLGTLGWEFDENGELVDSRVQFFLPLAAR